MGDSLDDLDPDIREVFAELHRQDTALVRSLGLPPSPNLPPIEPIEIPDGAMLEQTKAQLAGAPHDMERLMTLMRESCHERLPAGQR